MSEKRAITKTVEGKCSQCGYSGDHDIVAMHAKGIGFCFGMECPACGKLVPESAWLRYLRTGDVIIPNLERSSKKDKGMAPKSTKNYIRTATKGSRNYL